MSQELLEKNILSKQNVDKYFDHYLKINNLIKDNVIFQNTIDLKKLSPLEIVNIFNELEEVSPFKGKMNDDYEKAKKSIETFELNALQKGNVENLQLQNLKDIENHLNKHIEFATTNYPKMATEFLSLKECMVQNQNSCKIDEAISADAIAYLNQRETLEKGNQHDLSANLKSEDIFTQTAMRKHLKIDTLENDGFIHSNEEKVERQVSHTPHSPQP